MHRPAPRMPCPRHGTLGQQDSDLGIGAGLTLDQCHRVRIAVGREPTAIGGGVGDRGRQADAAQAGRDHLEPRQCEAQKIATLAGREGMDFVDHHRPQIGEHHETVGIGQQQRQRFGGGQQDVRGAAALARLLVGTGVAAAALDADVERHLGDRGSEVAFDVGRERLQRRHVQRVQPVGRMLRQIDERGQESR